MITRKTTCWTDIIRLTGVFLAVEYVIERREVRASDQDGDGAIVKPRERLIPTLRVAVTKVEHRAAHEQKHC